jgi:hypothetical protein
MTIDVYVGTERLDFNENLNIVYSIGDLRNLNIGSNNKSYTLNIPLTDNNKKILKFVNKLSSKTEVTGIGRIFIDGGEILKGAVKILSTGDAYSKIIIEANDWADSLSNTKLKDVTGLAAKAVTLTATNVSDSWSAVDPFIRFGMIHFCKRWSEVTAYWSELDFVPSFSVVQLLTLILAPYTIVSDWFATTYAEKLFFLGVEPKANSDFINGKELEVVPANDVENSGTWVLPTGEGNHTFTFNPVVFSTETKDTGNDFAAGVYTVPATGTYRFKWAIVPHFYTTTDSEDLSWVDNGMTRLCAIYTKVGGAGGAIALASNSVALTIDVNDINALVTLDTGWVHLTAGDTVYCYFSVFIEVENLDVADSTWYAHIEITSKFENTWDYRNQYAGIGKSINPVDYMPDKTALEFLQGIKHFANLVFYIDRRKNNIYIEPSDTFFSSEVKDLSSRVVNFEEIVSESIASNYTNKIVLGFQGDTSDKAYNEQVKESGIPYQKNITLTSEYAKSDITKMLNPFFASTVVKTLTGLPSIFGGEEYVSIIFDQLYPVQRPVGHIPRIFTWEGLTAGSNWYYNSVLQTDYPKLQVIDFSTLYDTYYIKTFHHIDKGRAVSVKVNTTPTELMEFMGVLSSSTKEGFRTKYMIYDGKEYHYLRLEKITTNGKL